MKKMILLENNIPFNLDATLSCGQVFQWICQDRWWTGVVRSQVWSVKQENGYLLYDGTTEEELIRYFNLDLDLLNVIHSIDDSIKQIRGCEVDHIFEMVSKSNIGLRIIKQDPWECLLSYICSQNSNIPTITKRIKLLSARYGSSLQSEWYTYPTPSTLACSTFQELKECSTGYRASYLQSTAYFINNHPDFLKRLENLSTQEARKCLLSLPGVGPKVADCVLLFAYNLYDSVPVDVWIRKIITSIYFHYLKSDENGPKLSYDKIVEFCRDYFGKYCGYAQQYLFSSRNELSSIIP